MLSLSESHSTIVQCIKQWSYRTLALTPWYVNPFRLSVALNVRFFYIGGRWGNAD